MPKNWNPAPRDITIPTSWNPCSLSQEPDKTYYIWKKISNQMWSFKEETTILWHHYFINKYNEFQQTLISNKPKTHKPFIILYQNNNKIKKFVQREVFSLCGWCRFNKEKCGPTWRLPIFPLDYLYTNNPLPKGEKDSEGKKVPRFRSG